MTISFKPGQIYVAERHQVTIIRVLDHGERALIRWESGETEEAFVTTFAAHAQWKLRSDHRGDGK